MEAEAAHSIRPMLASIEYTVVLRSAPLPSTLPVLLASSSRCVQSCGADDRPYARRPVPDGPDR